ncbi:MAG: MoaD/ThiS family protein [Bacteroidia bacterium]|nr:MoaD/ThiS family protein [Bacteroidia bacterium]MCZ2141198.1 MoaD/ThiS family protein [Bacteroidia bacterium]
MENLSKLNTITIIAFGEIAEILNRSAISIENFTDTDSLEIWLHQNFKELKNKTYKIAVNKKLILNNTQLQSGDEVALMPPFSGG